VGEPRAGGGDRRRRQLSRQAREPAGVGAAGCPDRAGGPGDGVGGTDVGTGRARFSDTIDPLLPALTRGVETVAGRRQADLLAHVGWAYFLKSRDGGTDESDPEPFYRRAVAADPSNPYAHAHWGHWLAWKRRPIDDAGAHFAAALASGRARPYVRSLQLAALQLAGTDASQSAFLAAVADMVRNQEPVAPGVRNAVLGLYERACRDDTRLARLAAAVPPATQIAVIRALFFDVDFDPARESARDACLTNLQEPVTAVAAPVAPLR